MNIDFFAKFQKFRISTITSAEDFADKINYQYSTFFILLAMSLIAVKQYIFTPIQCWIPAEWNRGWEEYAENLCWIQDTYFVALDKEPPNNVRERKETAVSYYQWIPFVLALQMAMFYIPHFTWKQLSQRIGSNVNQMVKMAADCAVLDQGKRAGNITQLAIHIERLLVTSKKPRYVDEEEAADDQMHVLVSRSLKRVLPCFWYGKRSGFYLISLYFTIKLIYLGNAIGQLFLMQRFLGFRSITFGFDVLYNISHGQQWESSGAFPRIVWCDVQKRYVANMQQFSVQCVLPVNMLNEKVYIFMWFWVVFCGLSIVVSMAIWIMRLSFETYRKRFIKNYLKVMHSFGDDEKMYLHRFLQDALSYDGVFVLRMISRNCGDIISTDVIQAVWNQWKEKNVPKIVADVPETSPAEVNPPDLKKAPPSYAKAEKLPTVKHRPNASRNTPSNITGDKPAIEV